VGLTTRSALAIAFTTGPLRYTHSIGHLVKLQPLVQVGEELGSTSVSYSTSTEKSIVKRLVLDDTLAEWSALEVDDESRHLLTETQEVDGGIEQSWRVFGVNIDNSSAGNGTSIGHQRMRVFIDKT
jgi:hypothetical protein